MSLFPAAPRLLPHDHVLRATLLPLIPAWVRPNHLTLLRFLLTPAVAWLMLREEYRTATTLFAAAVLTDALDGSLARVRDQITRWGQTYDPLADKLLMGVMFVLLAFPYFFYTTLLIILIDLSFIAAGWYWKRQGYEITANVWGKLKMICQVAAVLLLLLLVMGVGPAGLAAAAHWLLMAAILLAVASLITHGI